MNIGWKTYYIYETKPYMIWSNVEHSMLDEECCGEIDIGRNDVQYTKLGWTNAKKYFLHPFT